MLQEVGPQLTGAGHGPASPTVQVLEQIAQALDSVRLPGPVRLVRSLARACQQNDLDAEQARHLPQLLQLAHGDALRYLTALAQNAPADSASLFDSYRALTRLGGKDTAHPADLWQPHGDATQASLPPALTSSYPTLVPCEAVRAELDQAVLGWVKSNDTALATILRQICLGLAHSAPTPALRSAWQLAAGWLDAQAHGLLAPDMYAKRLAARVLMLYGQQIKGASAATAPLLHELLFFCAQAVDKLQAAPPGTAPILAAICASCQLLPAADRPGTPPRETPPAPFTTPVATAPVPPLERTPASAIPGAVELQPLATLTQGMAALPQIQVEASTLHQAERYAMALQTALTRWIPDGAGDSASPPASAQSRPDAALPEGLRPDADGATLSPGTIAAQLTRHAWDAGWAEVATLAHLIQRVAERCPAPPPADMSAPCQHAAAEIERLLQYLAQGFHRRAQPQVAHALEQCLQRLPAPPSEETATGLSEKEAASADEQTTSESKDSEMAQNQRNELQPLHFSVLEEEMQTQWPQLQAALRDWADGSPCPPALLRALHTLKGSARLAGAAAWASQVHALETLAFAPDSSAAALAEPLEALRLGFAALQQEIALHHPRQRPGSGQPLENLQRHTQALWASHSQAQEGTEHSQTAVSEMAAGLERLHALVQDCKVWANTLMVYGDMDLSYEWHSELQDLLGGLLNATDDLGTVQRQLQHHHQETAQALQTQSGYLQAMQHSLLYASLQPLGQLKERLEECLRLAEQDCQRQAQLHWQGEATLLEKTTLQALAPSLEHLLRNSLAHGIEAPHERLRRNKPAQGQITLALREDAGQHILTLHDDGAGLDLVAIGQRAAALGLWTQPAPPTPQEAAQLILQPRLSTAQALTETAGRGIGMEAVLAQIQALGGSLHIASRTGHGCTVTLTLPAPPAVLPIQVLRAGSWQVALPAQWIEGVRRIPLALAEQGLAQAMLHGDPRGPLPLFWAGALWQQSTHSRVPPLDGHALVVIVRSPTQRWGLWVDALQPEQEVLLQAPTGLNTPIAGLLGTASLPTGQVVQVYEPAAVIAAHETRQHTPPPDPAPAPERPLVLLVDDSISVRRLAQHLLVSHGWQVATAADGLAALQLLQEGLLPRLMLVDIEMPGMNGLELLRRLRQEPRWQQLSVVMLTAHEAGPVSQQALDMGAQAYLTKPYTPQQLLAQVRRYTSAALPGEASSPATAG